jgi:hypothetical protein
MFCPPLAQNLEIYKFVSGKCKWLLAAAIFLCWCGCALCGRRAAGGWGPCLRLAACGCGLLAAGFAGLSLSPEPGALWAWGLYTHILAVAVVTQAAGSGCQFPMPSPGAWGLLALGWACGLWAAGCRRCNLCYLQFCNLPGLSWLLPAIFFKSSCNGWLWP